MDLIHDYNPLWKNELSNNWIINTLTSETKMSGWWSCASQLISSAGSVTQVCREVTWDAVVREKNVTQNNQTNEKNCCNDILLQRFIYGIRQVIKLNGRLSNCNKQHNKSRIDLHEILERTIGATSRFLALINPRGIIVRTRLSTNLTWPCSNIWHNNPMRRQYNFTVN